MPLAIARVAAVLLFRLRRPVLRTLAACALLGLAAGPAGRPSADPPRPEDDGTPAAER